LVFFGFSSTSNTQKKKQGNKRMTGVDEDFLGVLQKANVSGATAAAAAGLGIWRC
jgi:hypothetical protein